MAKHLKITDSFLEEAACVIQAPLGTKCQQY